jgi:hypothetical protein
MGCLRIGTLYDYRRAEHRRGITDPSEGKKQVLHHVSSLHITDSSDPSMLHSKDFRAMEEFRAIRIGNSKGVRLENVTFAQSFDAPDCFIYCLSSTNSRKMYGEFEESNSCAEIVDLASFLRLVTESLNAIIAVKFQGLHRVTYVPRSEQWNGEDWGTHPALLKDSTFSKQAEFRAIWTPIYEREIKPLVIGNSQIPSACRLLNL